MFDVLVSLADQIVNVCRITDFWITETIIAQEKADETTKKEKITKVINGETVLVQLNSFVKKTAELN